MAETSHAEDQQKNHEQAARDYCLRLAQQIKTYPRRRIRRGPSPEEDEIKSSEGQKVADDEEAHTNGVLRASLEELWSKETGLPGSPSLQTITEAGVSDIETSLYADPQLQATMASVVEYPPSEWLLEQELAARGDWPPVINFRELDLRQPDARVRWWSIDLVRTEMIAAGKWREMDGNPDVYLVAEKLACTGLCFSGGGIRSATFNLGVLQGLAKLGRLARFDYLSTVSGGGYIHQFLAAWLTRDGVLRVQKDLEPLPGPPSTRIFWPEPLRWLRRYSNYLTPQVGLFTADTWVAVSIWLRNTFLNQIVLISVLMFVLTLPHLQLPHNGRVAKMLLDHGGWTAAAILLCFLITSVTIFRQMGPPSSSCDDDVPEAQGSSQGWILAWVLLPIVIASFLVSPYFYRSAFWMGDKPPKAVAPCWASAIEATFGTGLAPVSSVEYLKELHALDQNGAWKARASGGCRFDETAFLYDTTLLHTGGIKDLRQWNSLYSFHWWRPGMRFWNDPSDSKVFLAFLIGIALIVISCWNAIARLRPKFIFALAIPGAIIAAYFMIGIARWLLFTASFFLRVDLVTRLNIAILPPIIIAIIFISIELAGGLIGNLVDESVREWFARLRAWSFLFCIAWLSWTAAALLGPSLVDHLLSAAHKPLGTSVVLGWIGTTIASVLAGKSPVTSGTSGDNKSSLSRWLNILALVGPPVFVVGLTLLLANIVERILDAIARSAPYLGFYNPEYALLLVILVLVAALFGWRVDINEFSLHAFYRDRLARCYAGATTPDRRPNLFTGFAAGDKRIRMADLLPTSYSKTPRNLLRRDKNGIPVLPDYQGPFPIFCTTINLSFGEDMAYQERKGAAFAFTPLYCGYDVGWTEADTNRVQFNGFTPTLNFAYDCGGPRMATAVAASGAAISPNWGYHTSPTMAFLLTIFNVRLGLWIRNPRHKRFWSSWMRLKENPSSPVFGLFYLLRELFGMVNDAAPFVYLTDGGHFENMGLYELVRRHAMKIVICDAEEDGRHTFEGIGMAIRKCRIDFGAEIKLNIAKLEPKAGSSLTKIHSVQGSIQYPSGATGQILYVKTALTAGLPADLINYHKEHPAFPNDTTANQWFTESQFESYRRLGQESAVAGIATAWLAGV